MVGGGRGSTWPVDRACGRIDPINEQEVLAWAGRSMPACRCDCEDWRAPDGVGYRRARRAPVLACRQPVRAAPVRGEERGKEGAGTCCSGSDRSARNQGRTERRRPAWRGMAASPASAEPDPSSFGARRGRRARHVGDRFGDRKHGVELGRQRQGEAAASSDSLLSLSLTRSALAG